MPVVDLLRCAGDDLFSGESSAQLVSTLPNIEASLRRRFPTTDHHLIAEAAEDAVFEILRRDRLRRDAPHNRPTLRLLKIVAWRRLANKLRGEARRQRYESAAARALYDRQLSAPTGREPRLTREVLRSACAVLTEIDRLALRLILHGESRTAVFAMLLGVADRRPDEQRQAVKRMKDRIAKRLRRSLMRASE